MRILALARGALALLLAACAGSHNLGADAAIVADAGPSRYRGAYISPDCAPDDGLAYRVLLYETAVPECSADPSGRSLMFYFFEGSSSFFPITAPETITSSSASPSGNGIARECPGGTIPCRSSMDWSLTLDTFVEGGSASGSYEITFDGAIVRGRFEASHCAPSPVMCG